MVKRNANLTNFQLLVSIWKAFNPKRKRQFLIINFLILISALAETFSIASIVPLISILTTPETLMENKYIQYLILNLGIYKSDKLFISITLFFICSVLIACFIRILTLWIISRFSALTGSDLSSESYSKNIYQPYTVQVSRNTAEVVAINSVEITATVNTITNFLKILLSLFFTFFIILFLLNYDFKLGILSLTVFASSYLLVTFFARITLFKNSKYISSARTKQIKFLNESFGSIKDIILNNNFKFYLSIFSRLDIRMRIKMAQNVFISNFPRALIESIAFIYIAFLALYVVLNEGNSILILSKFAVIAVTCQKLLPQLQQIYSSWAKIKGNAKSIQKVLDSINQSVTYISSDKQNDLFFNEFIRLNNIFYKYKGIKKNIIKGIDLTIYKSEKIGIIGKTGVGKTTLIDIVIGLIRPSKGEIAIDNIVLKDNHLITSWRSKIAYVPQNIYLFDASIMENIACGLSLESIDINKVKTSAKKAKIHNFIEELPLGYKTHIGEMGMKLSGGQRQRIGIARAIFNIKTHDKKLLVLDEATSSLDKEVENQVINSLYEISKDLTVLIISHSYSTLLKCDRIIRINNGIILEEGSPKEILK